MALNSIGYQLLNLDINKRVVQTFFLNNKDVNSRGLELHIYDNSKTYDCTGYTVKMYVKDKTGTIFTSTGTAVSAALGVYNIPFQSGMAAGKGTIEIRISDSDEDIGSTNIPVDITNSIISDHSLLQAPGADILYDVIQNEPQRVSAEVARADAETARVTEFNEMINSGFIILKNPVSTFEDLETTYGNTNTKWTAQTLNDGKIYRCNGTEWIWFETLTLGAYTALLNEVLYGRGTYASLKERFEADESQLAAITYYATPEMYGAKGDGVTDDTNAFHDAINSGLPLYLGAKTYKINQLNETSNLYLMGCGKNKTTIICGNITSIGYTEVSDIHFVCDESVLIADINDGYTSLDTTAILQIGIQSYLDGVKTGLIQKRAPGGKIKNCKFSYLNSCNYYAFNLLANNVENVIVDNCEVNNTGLQFRYCTYFIVSNCFFDMELTPINNSSEPIHAPMVDGGIITGNKFINNTQDDIDLYPSAQNVIVSSNIFYRSEQSQVGSLTLTIKTQMRDNDTGSATNFRDSGIKNISIINNIFYVNCFDDTVIQLVCFDDRTNKTSNVSNLLPRNIKIENNIFHANSTRELRVLSYNGGFTNFYICDNVIENLNGTSQILYDKHKTNNLNYHFETSGMIIKNNICKCNKIERDTVILEDVNGLIFENNLCDFGNDTSSIITSTTAFTFYNCKISSIRNNFVIGQFYKNSKRRFYYILNSSGYDTILTGNYEQFLNNTNVTDGTVINGFDIDSERVYINTSFNVAINSTDKSYKNMLWSNQFKILGNESVLQAINKTTNEDVRAIIKNDDGYTTIRISGIYSAGNTISISGCAPIDMLGY